MKIKIDPEKKITLYNKEFDVMRNMLDKAIQATIRDLIKRDLSSGAVALKIDIDLMRAVIDDDNAPTGKRERVIPEITAKIARTMTWKDDERVSVVNLKSRKELLMDDTGEFFIVSEEEDSGQLSMFNSFDEFSEEVIGRDDSRDGDEDD